MEILRGTRRLEALALLAATGLGTASCASRFAAPYGPAAHITIAVVADDAVIPDPVRLSKKQKHEADWYSWPGSTLKILFDDAALFPQLNCSGNHCSSGPIRAEAAETAYRYHAQISFGEKQSSLDPTLMIQP